MFANMDTDKSGTITYDELKSGLARLGSKLTEAEVKQLMEAVSYYWILNTPTFCCIAASYRTHILLFTFRLMWMAMEELITLNSLLLQCIDTS